MFLAKETIDEVVSFLMLFYLIKYMLALLFNEVKNLQKKITKRSGKEKNKHIKSKNKTKAANKKADVKEKVEEVTETSTRKPEIIGIIFVAIGLISLCGLLGLNVGFVGLKFARFLKYFFGIGASAVSLLFVVCGGYYIMQHKKVGINKTSVGVMLLLFSLLAMYHHILIPFGKEILPESLADGGGIIGGMIALVLHKPLASTGTTIVLAAAIIGSVLLATPWSLATGILYTKEASEKGAGMALDVAEAVYDGAKNVGSKVQNQVGEQVQRIKSKKSFYNQANDASFIDDGPAMSQNTSNDAITDTGDINTIIKLDGSTDAPTWQAPEPTGEKVPFDGPDMNGYVESDYGHGYSQSEYGNEAYVSEFAQKAAGKLNKNLKKLDTSGFVNVQENKIPDKAFDNWRFRNNGEDMEELTPEELAEFEALNNQNWQDIQPEEEAEAETETETEIEVEEEFVDSTTDESPLIVSSIDELLTDDHEDTNNADDNDNTDDSDESTEPESEIFEFDGIDEIVEPEEFTDEAAEEGFAIEFSSDNEGESSFTKSLPEEEIDAPAEEFAAEAAEDQQEEPAEVVDKLELAAQLTEESAASAIEEKPLPPYEVPDVNLILDKKNKEKDEELEQEISEKAKVLAQTLQDFKVKANILSACHGPAVTRYEVKLAPGVKVNKLTGLADDIALSMAASSVRIEQIQNRSTIGIEVPNRKLESVQLREVLENAAFKEAKSNLTVGFGKDISGKAIFANLADMPHLLVAGATGSGKSVCINTIVTSILFKAKPDEVKFIMIDPKMVELSVYNDIPHLMVPVVTDARKAAAVLNWSVQEMEKRYGLIAEAGVRNIETYNQYYADDKAKQMPSVVIIIDELADLMMVAPHDVEDAICRLAQKARAAGIYLVLATQRPSVNVITGVIKANIPSRISFAVTSQIDSRTILDSAGAEKLLGKGDMLFKPQTEPKAVRVQGAFVSDLEVERLVESILQQGHKCEINQDLVDFTNRADNEGENGEPGVKGKSNVDELLRQAVELVMQTGNASASSFQRRYHIGYTRAGRLLDTMEQLNIVGPPQGSKPREILVTEDQAFEIMDKLEEYLKEEK